MDVRVLGLAGIVGGILYVLSRPSQSFKVEEAVLFRNTPHPILPIATPSQNVATSWPNIKGSWCVKIGSTNEGITYDFVDTFQEAQDLGFEALGDGSGFAFEIWRLGVTLSKDMQLYDLGLLPDLDVLYSTPPKDVPKVLHSG